MSRIRVDLLPLDRLLEVAPGTKLQELLFDQGAEFPCGGKGRCRGCRIRVLDGVGRDTTEFVVGESGKLYLAAILEAHHVICSMSLLSGPLHGPSTRAAA